VRTTTTKGLRAAVWSGALAFPLSTARAGGGPALGSGIRPSPSRAPAHPKKTRGVAVQAALAAAAPPITADN
jgi:hypothetical protein